MAADPKITKLLGSVDKEDSRLVSVVEEVLQLLEADKMAWRVRIPPLLVGVHPENRNGYGVSAPEVHRLGSDVVSMGWSPAATYHAVCVEDSDGKVGSFTEKLAKASPGLGSVSASQIKYGSLSCSHTNQFLVALHCEVESEHTNLTVDGRMSPNKLSKDPMLKDALENGLTWLVISGSVPATYPSLCELVQAARNSTGAVHRKENEFQLLAKVQHMAETMSKDNKGVVDWDLVLRTVVKRSQASAAEVEPLLKFIQRYGGGDQGTFAKDLEAFHKMFVPAGRVVPATTFQALADLKLSALELCPHFVCAVLKAQASCPKTKVCPNKICRYITGSDIASLQGSKKVLMQDAEKVLLECRSIARRNGVIGSVATRCFGRLDTFMARLVLGKKDDKFSNVEDVGRNFVEDLLNEAKSSGTDVSVESPWASPAAPSQPASSSATAAIPNFVQYDAEGQAKDPEAFSLKVDGFEVGSLVKDVEGQIYQVAEMNGDGVVAKRLLPDGAVGTSTSFEYSEFAGKFRQTTTVYENMHDWQEHTASKQPAYQEAVLKAHVLTAMSVLAADSASKLRVQVKPVRSVFADDNYGPNKLLLVPETTKVASPAADGQPPKGGLECNIVYSQEPGEKKSLYLLPSFGDTFVVPAWAVRFTEHEQEANVSIVKKSVTITFACKKEKCCSVDVVMPVLSNPKRVKKGEELFIFREPATNDKNKGLKRDRTLNLSTTRKAKALKS